MRESTEYIKVYLDCGELTDGCDSVVFIKYHPGMTNEQLEKAVLDSKERKAWWGNDEEQKLIRILYCGKGWYVMNAPPPKQEVETSKTHMLCERDEVGCMTYMYINQWDGEETDTEETSEEEEEKDRVREPIPRSDAMKNEFEAQVYYGIHPRNALSED